MTEAEAEDVVWREAMRPSRRELAEAQAVLAPKTAEAVAWLHARAEAARAVG